VHALQIEFLRPMTACILSERRAVRPFGILGGGSALAGVNLLLTSDGRTVNIGGKNTVQLSAGERLRILTPGVRTLICFCWNLANRCLHLAGITRGRGLAAFICSSSADAPCLLARKPIVVLMLRLSP
jgi:hypothetical protein